MTVSEIVNITDEHTTITLLHPITYSDKANGYIHYATYKGKANVRNFHADDEVLKISVKCHIRETAWAKVEETELILVTNIEPDFDYKASDERTD